MSSRSQEKDISHREKERSGKKESISLREKERSERSGREESISLREKESASRQEKGSGRSGRKEDILEVVDYSTRSIAVFGNTGEYRSLLREKGGKFNNFLKRDGVSTPGWIFGVKETASIVELVDQVNSGMILPTDTQIKKKEDRKERSEKREEKQEVIVSEKNFRLLRKKTEDSILIMGKLNVSIGDTVTIIEGGNEGEEEGDIVMLKKKVGAISIGPYSFIDTVYQERYVSDLRIEKRGGVDGDEIVTIISFPPLK